ncbi:hypothetical protein GCM10007981_19280 [Thermocladium modestius]|uniref:Uncharacterized protein n=1 Tax=Thermocladium modestius TaxID=62609 RepID=A0A830GY26_9CREN|nr:hypothetical protein [Thermocladium modestius]GGP22592.1 hypothetical protein GCM10007981_19280 [Thermocladium modestius]
MDLNSIKSFVKDYVKKNGLIEVRYVKVREVEGVKGQSMVLIGIYLDKPMKFDALMGLLNGLTALIGAGERWIYAPHGKEIRLMIAQSTAPSTYRGRG